MKCGIRGLLLLLLCAVIHAAYVPTPEVLTVTDTSVSIGFRGANNIEKVTLSCRSDFYLPCNIEQNVILTTTDALIGGLTPMTVYYVKICASGCVDESDASYFSTSGQTKSVVGRTSSGGTRSDGQGTHVIFENPIDVAANTDPRYLHIVEAGGFVRLVDLVTNRVGLVDITAPYNSATIVTSYYHNGSYYVNDAIRGIYTFALDWESGKYLVDTDSFPNQASLDGIIPTQATIHKALQFERSPDDNVFFSEGDNPAANTHKIRKITPSSVTTVLSAPEIGNFAYNLDNNTFCYVYRQCLRVFNGAIATTFAGQDFLAGFTDGTGTAAAFLNPGPIIYSGINDIPVFDIADGRNRTAIRRVTADGNVMLLSGQQSEAPAFIPGVNPTLLPIKDLYRDYRLPRVMYILDDSGLRVLYGTKPTVPSLQLTKTGNNVCLNWDTSPFPFAAITNLQITIYSMPAFSYFNSLVISSNPASTSLCKTETVTSPSYYAQVMVMNEYGFTSTYAFYPPNIPSTPEFVSNTDTTIKVDIYYFAHAPVVLFVNNPNDPTDFRVIPLTMTDSSMTRIEISALRPMTWYVLRTCAQMGCPESEKSAPAVYTTSGNIVSFHDLLPIDGDIIIDKWEGFLLGLSKNQAIYQVSPLSARSTRYTSNNVTGLTQGVLSFYYVIKAGGIYRCNVEFVCEIYIRKDTAITNGNLHSSSCMNPSNLLFVEEEKTLIFVDHNPSVNQQYLRSAGVFSGVVSTILTFETPDATKNFTSVVSINDLRDFYIAYTYSIFKSNGSAISSILGNPTQTYSVGTINSYGVEARFASIVSQVINPIDGTLYVADGRFLRAVPPPSLNFYNISSVTTLAGNSQSVPDFQEGSGSNAIFTSINRITRHHRHNIYYITDDSGIRLMFGAPPPISTFDVLGIMNVTNNLRIFFGIDYPFIVVHNIYVNVLDLSNGTVIYNDRTYFVVTATQIYIDLPIYDLSNYQSVAHQFEINITLSNLYGNAAPITTYYPGTLLADITTSTTTDTATVNIVDDSLLGLYQFLVQILDINENQMQGNITVGAGGAATFSGLIPGTIYYVRACPAFQGNCITGANTGWTTAAVSTKPFTRYIAGPSVCDEVKREFSAGANMIYPVPMYLDDNGNVILVEDSYLVRLLSPYNDIPDWREASFTVLKRTSSGVVFGYDSAYGIIRYESTDDLLDDLDQGRNPNIIVPLSPSATTLDGNTGVHTCLFVTAMHIEEIGGSALIIYFWEQQNWDTVGKLRMLNTSVENSSIKTLLVTGGNEFGAFMYNRVNNTIRYPDQDYIMEYVIDTNSTREFLGGEFELSWMIGVDHKNGIGSDATFSKPSNIEADGAGGLFINEGKNVRRVIDEPGKPLWVMDFLTNDDVINMASGCGDVHSLLSHPKYDRMLYITDNSHVIISYWRAPPLPSFLFRCRNTSCTLTIKFDYPIAICDEINFGIETLTDNDEFVVLDPATQQRSFIISPDLFDLYNITADNFTQTFPVTPNRDYKAYFEAKNYFGSSSRITIPFFLNVPRNVRVDGFNDTSSHVIWNATNTLGPFRVQLSNLTANVSSEVVNTTEITFSNLSPMTSYVVIICSVNILTPNVCIGTQEIPLMFMTSGQYVVIANQNITAVTTMQIDQGSIYVLGGIDKNTLHAVDAYGNVDRILLNGFNNITIMSMNSTHTAFYDSKLGILVARGTELSPEVVPLLPEVTSGASADGERGVATCSKVLAMKVESAWLYFVEYTGKVRRVHTGFGTTNTIYTQPDGLIPGKFDYFQNRLYITYNETVIYVIQDNGPGSTPSLIIGNTTTGHVNGPPAIARFNKIKSVKGVVPTDLLFIAEENRLRCYNTNGYVMDVMGSGSISPGSTGFGSSFDFPDKIVDIVVSEQDADGQIYILHPSSVSLLYSRSPSISASISASISGNAIELTIFPGKSWADWSYFRIGTKQSALNNWVDVTYYPSNFTSPVVMSNLLYSTDYDVRLSMYNYYGEYLYGPATYYVDDCPTSICHDMGTCDMFGVCNCTEGSAGNYCQNCAPGYGLNSTSLLCEKCNPTYVTNTTTNECHACPPGHYSSDHLVCQTCPVGTVYFARQCTACGPNEYQANATHCVPCGLGLYKFNETSCASCAEGMIVKPGQNNCTACAANEYVANNTSCVVCPAGSVSLRTKCEDCTPGNFTSDGITCTSCPNGYVSKKGSTNCTLCAAGTYRYNASTCMSCPMGSVSSSGSYQCTQCQPGHHPINFTTCAPCPTGSISVNGSQCTQCHPGSYANISTCIPCANGSVSTAGSSQCTPCDAGKYAINSTACVHCPNNSISESGSTNCTACGVGLYAVDGTYCSSCPPGFINNNGVCTSCSAGTYVFNTTYCGGCDAGWVSTAGSTTCTQCTAGQYAYNTSHCIPCESGMVSSAGSTLCLSCPSNQIPYNSSHCTNNNNTTPTPTPTPTQPPNNNNNNTNTTCQPGSVLINNNVCVVCPAGQYAANNTTCVVCPAGLVAESAGATQCISCPSGKVAENSTTCVVIPTSCNPGYYVAIGACYPCPNNTYSAGGNVTTCISCSSYTYAGPAASSCRPCYTHSGPYIQHIDKDYVLSTGGGAITLIGVGLKTAHNTRCTPVVTVGGDSCTDVTLVSDTQISCMAPSGSGARSVVVKMTDSAVSVPYSLRYYANQCSVFNGGCDPRTNCTSYINGTVSGCTQCPVGFSYVNAKCVTSCGDGTCDETLNEDCISCPADCNAPCGKCGDGTCSGTETCQSCPVDCACTQTPQCPTGANGQQCSNQGKCISDVCVCYTGFNGPSCDSETVPYQVIVNNTKPVIIIVPPTSTTITTTGSHSTTNPSTTSPAQQGDDPDKTFSFTVAVQSVRELNAQKEVIASYDLTDIGYIYAAELIDTAMVYSYTVQLPNTAVVTISLYIFNQTTDIQFAGQNITVNPNEIKMTVSVTDWPFASLRNSFEMVLNSAVSGNAEEQNNDDGCQTESATSHKNSQGILSWYKLILNNVALYGTFLPNALVDGRTRALGIVYSPATTTQTTGVTKEGTVYVSSPVFLDQLIVDPNFSVLLDPNPTSDDGTCRSNLGGPARNNISTTTAIAIAVSVAGVVAIGVAAYIIRKRQIARAGGVNRRLMMSNNHQSRSTFDNKSAVKSNPQYQSPMQYSTEYGKM